MSPAFHTRNDPPAPDQNVDRRRYLENNVLTVPTNVIHTVGAASDGRVSYRTVEVNVAFLRFGTPLEPLSFQLSPLSGSPLGNRSHPITPIRLSQGSNCIKAARLRLRALGANEAVRRLDLI